MIHIPKKIRSVNEKNIKFIEENILSRFGFPTQIVTDNAAAFSSG